MKKKISLLVLGLLLLMRGLNVYADTIPHDYEHNNYSYSINSFALRVYEFIYDGNDEMTDESWSDFINDQFVREVEIPASTVVVTPSYHSETVQGVSVEMINLDLQMTAGLETLLQTELADTDPTKVYYAEIVAYYTLKGAPEGYDRFFKTNVYKEVEKATMANNWVVPDNLDLSQASKPINLNESNAQVINAFFVRDGDVEYTRAVEYMIVEDTFSFVTMYNTTTEETKYIMFSNVDDTAALAEAITDYYTGSSTTDPTNPTNPTTDPTTPTNPQTGTDTTTKQTVEVPNTAMDVPKAVWIGGILSIVVGASVVLFVTRKQGNKA